MSVILFKIFSFIFQLVMVMMRTTRWPAVVVRREEVDATSPSTMAHRKVTVNIYTKGERVVQEKDITPYTPSQSFTKKPKDWKNAMVMAEMANKSRI